jgi:hypothetical protein
MVDWDAKVTKASILLKLVKDEEELKRKLNDGTATDGTKQWLRARLDYIKSLETHIKEM